ncbi:glycosyltransferase family 4 protein, partial [Enterococcus faecium]|uniref:glycosyltransferase family 4 protein n=1 Tax=Enterococcus faecium TaxID=1352 RepID=UPI000F65202C
ASVDELRKIYTSATYFVNPTFNDTFPTAIMEALSCGTPVITFKTGGSPESITNKTGLVIDEKNAETLSDIIISSPYFKSGDCVQQAKNYERKDKYKEYLNFFNKIY